MNNIINPVSEAVHLAWQRQDERMLRLIDDTLRPILESLLNEEIEQCIKCKENGGTCDLHSEALAMVDSHGRVEIERPKKIKLTIEIGHGELYYDFSQLDLITDFAELDTVIQHLLRILALVIVDNNSKFESITGITETLFEDLMNSNPLAHPYVWDAKTEMIIGAGILGGLTFGLPEYDAESA